jgi:hypothetical protein
MQRETRFAAAGMSRKDGFGSSRKGISSQIGEECWKWSRVVVFGQWAEAGRGGEVVLIQSDDKLD